MQKKLIKFGIFISCVCLLTFSFFIVTNVQNAKAEQGSIWDKTISNFGKTEGTAGYSEIGSPTKSIEEIISSIIKIMLSFVGGIFLILVVLGGYGWMMSGGNEEKLKASQKRLLNGVLGMLIILTAYIITDFVVKFIIAATL